MFRMNWNAITGVWQRPLCGSNFSNFNGRKWPTAAILAQLQGSDVDASVTFTGSKWKAY
jgi:hypothetical protein